MMFCVLSEKDGVADWCERHKRFHHGHTTAIATENSARAEAIRRNWDRVVTGEAFKNVTYVTTTPSRLRRKELAMRCVSLGENLTKEEAQAAGVLYATKCCNGGVFAYRCSLKGSTNLDICQCCTEFSERSPNIASEPTRHLLYHLWPTKSVLGIWQRNLDQLKMRWGLFNGRRILAVVTDGYTNTLASVQDYMRGYDCDWIHLENDPKMREVKTFWALWDRVRDCDGDNHYTFYAQGKGATKPDNRNVTVHRWTTAMYHLGLDYWPLVHAKLKDFPVVGSFKKNCYGFSTSTSAWHYSGSFAWFRNKDLFTKPDWSRIDREWWGIESYPSLHFTSQQAGCIFYEKPRGNYNLYQLNFYEGIERQMETWRREHRQSLSVTGSLMTGASRSPMT